MFYDVLTVLSVLMEYATNQFPQKCPCVAILDPVFYSLIRLDCCVNDIFMNSSSPGGLLAMNIL